MFYADWPGLIPDDGLLTANQVLCGDCGACTHTSCHPHFSNVIVVSVQPERNIQLFPTGGKALTIYCCTVHTNTPRFPYILLPTQEVHVYFVAMITL